MAVGEQVLADSVTRFIALENVMNSGLLRVDGRVGKLTGTDHVYRDWRPTEIIGKSNQSGCFVFQTVINSVPGPL